MADVLPRMHDDLGGEALRRRFAHILDEPVPPGLLRAARHGAIAGRRRRWRRAALVATACLALGGGSFMALGPAEKSPPAAGFAVPVDVPLPDLMALGYSLSLAGSDGVSTLRAIYDRIGGGTLVLVRVPVDERPRAGLPSSEVGAVWRDGDFVYSLVARGHAIGEVEGVVTEMRRQFRASLSSVPEEEARPLSASALTAFAWDVAGNEIRGPAYRDFAVPPVPPLD